MSFIKKAINLKSLKKKNKITLRLNKIEIFQTYFYFIQNQK